MILVQGCFKRELSIQDVILPSKSSTVTLISLILVGIIRNHNLGNVIFLRLLYHAVFVHFPPQKHLPGMLPVDPEGVQVLGDCEAFDSSWLTRKSEREIPKMKPNQNNGEVLEL